MPRTKLACPDCSALRAQNARLAEALRELAEAASPAVDDVPDAADRYILHAMREHARQLLKEIET